MPCGNAESGSLLRKDMNRESMNFGYYDSVLGARQATPVTCSKVYVGMLSDQSFTTTTETGDKFKTSDCFTLPTESERSYQLNGSAYTLKNPLFYSAFYGEGNLVITTGAATAVTGESHTVGAIGDGIATQDSQFIIPAYNQHFVPADGFVPTDLVVTGFTQGVDYEITRFNEYPAIITLAGGAISEGDVITFDYTYTAAVEVCEKQGGRFEFVARDWFAESNVTNVDTSIQDKIVELTFYDAEVQSDVNETFVGCEVGEPTASEFTITSESMDRCIKFR